MKERVAELVGPVAHRMWVSTFHSACARILRREAGLLGYRSSFSIYDQADATRLVDYVRRDMNLDPKRFPPRRLQGSISAMKNELIGPEQALANATTPPEKRLAEIYVEYQKRLGEASAADFDDLLLLVVQAVPRAPGRAAALAAPVPPRPGGRVPGHEPGPVGARPAPGRGAPQRDGRRRRRPVLRRPAPRSRWPTARTRPIEEIVAGDEVLSNYGSGDFRPARVLRVAPRARDRRRRRSRPRAAARSTSTPEHTHFAGHLPGFGVSSRGPDDAKSRRNERMRRSWTVGDAADGRDVVRRATRHAGVPSGRAVRERRGGAHPPRGGARPARPARAARHRLAVRDRELGHGGDRRDRGADPRASSTSRSSTPRGSRRPSGRGRDQHRPAVHPGGRGRARHGDGERERRVRAGRAASSPWRWTPRSTTSTSSRPTTSSPAASSPTTRSTRSAARTTATSCASRRRSPTRR